MLRRSLPLAALALGALVSTSALAQDDGDRQVKYKERTEIDFEGVDVSGELVKPSGSLLVDRKKAQFNPMIRLRTDFKPEMRESINEVK
ncbi:MAG: hypothetical protein EA397_09315 [Deltaproteobacteria bacterium]|nr:MAG: hypothetical protein EA397_09315 [Deltaproteobacteria bacterium]